MKKFNALTLLLISASDSFSPPYYKRQTRQLHQSAQQISRSTRQEIELDERPSPCAEGSSRRIKKLHAKKTRPFDGLSLDELSDLTQYYLSTQGGVVAGQTDGFKDDASQEVIEVSFDQTHEIKRLISSWSKLSSAGYISKPNRSDDEALDAIMLTKKEKVLAAEMAERCLRHLIEGNFDTVTMDLFLSVSFIVQSNLCHYLIHIHMMIRSSLLGSKQDHILIFCMRHLYLTTWKTMATIIYQ